MTAAEKERKAEARRIRAAKVARQRLLATEAAFAAEYKKVVRHIPSDMLPTFEYIAREIPKRENPKEVEFLRETRELHFRPYRKYLKPQEDSA